MPRNGHHRIIPMFFRKNQQQEEEERGKAYSCLLGCGCMIHTAILFSRYNVRPGNAILTEEKHLPMNHSKFYQGCSSCIGKDRFGEEMKRNAQTAGITAHYYKDENAPTGTCVVCIVGGERSLIANLFAVNYYKSEHLKKPDNWALDDPTESSSCGGHSWSTLSWRPGRRCPPYSPPSLQRSS